LPLVLHDRSRCTPAMAAPRPSHRRSRKISPMLKFAVKTQSAVARRKAEIEERGATAVEYGLMVGLIAVAIIGAVSFLSKSVKTTFNRSGNAMNSASSS
jgi:pilus assembly protein Flp/PilA